MRKTVLALSSALMLFATTLKAQVEQPISLGIKAGASSSWLQGLDAKTFGKNKGEQKMRLFLTGGAYVGYAFHDYVGMTLEVLYGGLGAGTSEKLDAKSKDKPKQFRIYSHNLLVPVTIDIFPMGYDPEEGILKFYPGVQFEFPLAVNVEKSKQGKPEELETDSKFKKEDHFNFLTVSLIGGIGYEFPEIGLGRDVRTGWGLTSLFKDDEKGKKYRKDEMDIADNKNVKNLFVTATIGYNFASLLFE